MADVLEIDASNGQVIERDFTDAEIAQREKDQAENLAKEVAEKAKAAAKTKLEQAAITHAKSLGFTDEMISVTYPTLVEE